MLDKVKHGLRIIGCLLLAALAMEFCARSEDAIRHSAPFWSNYDDDSLYTYDASGKHGKPHASYLKWKLNAAGYRGPELREGTWRIVCVGASETFGLYEKEDGEWPRVLEKILNSGGWKNRYEVVNAAYPGMTMSTILDRVGSMERELHPQLVIVYPNYTEYIFGHTTRKAKPQHKPSFRFRMADRVMNLAKNIIPVGVQDWLRQREIERAIRQSHVIDRLPQDRVDQFQSDLEQLVRVAHTGNSEVLLVTHATRFTIPASISDKEYLLRWRKFYPTLREEGFLDMETRMNSVMRKVGAQDSVSVVDAANLIPPGDVNFQDASHFSDSGARLMSELIASQVLKLH